MKSPKLSAYERTREKTRKKNQPGEMKQSFLGDEDLDWVEPQQKPDLTGLTIAGAGLVVGGGIGLLSGVAAIAVTASVGEVIIGGVVTKIAGIVGGAAGLGWGVSRMEKRKLLREKRR